MPNKCCEPLVSVVIPVYNVELYLEKCVKSVLSQTLKDIEIILVDDGSTDRSGFLCDELANHDARVQVIHQENQGLAGARNQGMLCARGKYLAFLDSDDYWKRPQALEEMMEMLHKEGSDVDCILFSYEKKNLKNSHNIPYEISPLPSGLSNYQKKVTLLKRRQYCNSACTKLYRREFLKENHFIFPVGKKSEDLVFSQMVLTKMKSFLIYYPSVLVYQINRAGSITTSFGTKNYEDIVQQMKQAIKDLQQTDIDEQRLGMAYWAEQVCWFLGYLPQSGKPIDAILKECEVLFSTLRWGLSMRTKLVNLFLACFGKRVTVYLLHYYLLHH